MSLICICKHELIRSWGFYRLYRFPTSVYALYHGSRELATYRNLVTANMAFDGLIVSQICKNLECAENERKTSDRNRS